MNDGGGGGEQASTAAPEGERGVQEGASEGSEPRGSAGGSRAVPTKRRPAPDDKPRNPYDRRINPRATAYVARVIREVDKGIVEREIAAEREKRMRLTREANRIAKMRARAEKKEAERQRRKDEERARRLAAKKVQRPKRRRSKMRSEAAA